MLWLRALPKELMGLTFDQIPTALPMGVVSQTVYEWLLTGNGRLVWSGRSDKLEAKTQRKNVSKDVPKAI